MQISAMRRPASIPPGAAMPASTSTAREDARSTASA